MNNKKVCIGNIGFSGSPEKGKEVIDTFRAIATPLVDTCQTTTYIGGIQRITEPLFGPKMSYYFTSRFLKGRELSSEFVEAWTERLKTQPVNVMVGLEDFHGPNQEKKSDVNAFSTRQHTWGTMMAVAYAPTAKLEGKDLEMRDEGIKWCRETIALLEKFIAPAFYYNYISQDEYAHSQKNWGDNFEKLSALKKKYDPDGLGSCPEVAFGPRSNRLGD